MITQEEWKALLATAEENIALYMINHNYHHPLAQFWKSIYFELTHGSLSPVPLHERFFTNSNISRFVYHHPIKGTVPRRVMYLGG